MVVFDPPVPWTIGEGCETYVWRPEVLTFSYKIWWSKHHQRYHPDPTLCRWCTLEDTPKSTCVTPPTQDSTSKDPRSRGSHTGSSRVPSSTFRNRMDRNLQCITVMVVSQCSGGSKFLFPISGVESWPPYSFLNTSTRYRWSSSIGKPLSSSHLGVIN